jgi:uncharacterized protein YkwD
VLGGTRALIALVGALFLLAAPATAAAPPKPRDLASADGLAVRILRGLNHLREENGLGLLHVNHALTAAAESHTTEMLEGGYFAHESADGTSYWQRLGRFYRPSRDREVWSVGENLYWAAPDVGAAQAIRNWLQSPRHRANLLNGDWRDVGISAERAKGVPGVFMGLDVTVLTVDFGVR